MTAKHCNGVPTDQPTIRNMTAYCEGRERAAVGGVVGDNPHAHDPDRTNWENGFDSWSADPATLPPKDCCSREGGGGYTPP